jgi:hypothetical protein
MLVFCETWHAHVLRRKREIIVLKKFISKYYFLAVGAYVLMCRIELVIFHVDFIRKIEYYVGELFASDSASTCTSSFCFFLLIASS